MTALEDLIPQLLDKTTQRKLQWEDLGSTSSFIAQLGSHSLELSMGREEVRLTLRDESGRPLETLSEATLAFPLTEQLQELFSLARRQALQVDSVLDDVKRKLERL